MSENETTLTQQVAVEKIKPAAHQARKTFDEEGIKALAESIQQEGLLQPVLVRPIGDEYELISGERRLRAVKLLGQPTIEAKIIQPSSEAEAAAKGLVENLQREDLNPIEEAEGFGGLNRLDPKYWGQSQIAKVAGRSQEYVSLSLKLMSLLPEVQESIRRRILSRSHGLELCRLQTPQQQIQAANKAKELTAKATRQMVDKMMEGAAKEGEDNTSKAADPLDSLWKQLETERFKLGCWSVSYPKEDQWVIHFKPNRENPVQSLMDLLDGLGTKISQYKLKLEEAQEAAASHKAKH